MNRTIRFLRSPKLAIGLIVGITAYSAVSTAIPQRVTDASAAAKWALGHPTGAAVAHALGMDNAFASPIFLAAVALLLISTITCAWQRTSVALRVIRDTRPSSLGADGAEPGSRTPPAAASEATVSLDRVESRLHDAGVAVARRDAALVASRRRWGALGSPIFHWALVALILLVGAGQLMRAEGSMNLVVGSPARDVSADYGGPVKRALLFPGHTGVGIEARDFELVTRVGGIDYGPSAMIEITRGGATVASGRVIPNSPLSYGPLLIHSEDDYGYAPLVSIRTTSGVAIGSKRVLISVDKLSSRGVGPGALVLSAPGRPNVVVSVYIPALSVGSNGFPSRFDRALLVSYKRGSEPTSPPVRVAEGASTTLPTGEIVTFVKRAMYLRVAVVNDWSVPWIYAAWAIAGIGLFISLVFPPRRARIAVDGDGGLRVSPVSQRSIWDQNMASEVRELLGTEPAENRQG